MKLMQGSHSGSTQSHLGGSSIKRRVGSTLCSDETDGIYRQWNFVQPYELRTAGSKLCHTGQLLKLMRDEDTDGREYLSERIEKWLTLDNKASQHYLWVCCR